MASTIIVAAVTDRAGSCFPSMMTASRPVGETIRARIVALYRQTI